MACVAWQRVNLLKCVRLTLNALDLRALAYGLVPTTDSQIEKHSLSCAAA